MTHAHSDVARTDRPPAPGKITLLRRIALWLNGRVDRRLGDVPAGEHTNATRRRQEQARQGELDVERWRVANCKSIEHQLSELAATLAARDQVSGPPPEPPAAPPGFPAPAWNARRACERAADRLSALDRDRAIAVQIAALRADQETLTQEARVAAAKWQVWFNEQVAIYERSRIRRRTEPLRLPPEYVRAMLCEMPPAIAPVTD